MFFVNTFYQFSFITVIFWWSKYIHTLCVWWALGTWTTYSINLPGLLRFSVVGCPIHHYPNCLNSRYWALLMSIIRIITHVLIKESPTYEWVSSHNYPDHLVWPPLTNAFVKNRTMSTKLKINYSGQKGDRNDNWTNSLSTELFPLHLVRLR